MIRMIAICLVLAGCSSIMDRQGQPDTRIVLGPHERVRIDRNEMDNYRCLDPLVLYCEGWSGFQRECSCRSFEF